MNKVLRRDIKPANILVKRQPLAAILGDVGAARYVLPIIASHEGGLSSDICTTWYRAPEALMMQRRYHLPSDVWSIGITMAELEVGNPPFRSRSEIGMLFEACSIFGTPSPTDWKAFGVDPQGLLGVLGKPILPQFPAKKKKPWGERFGSEFAGLMTQLLTMLPECRVTASDALKAKWCAAASGAQ
jgi:serine/threonine protein kinase